MRVLVTGGTGLVGRRVVARLARPRGRVLVLSRALAPPAACPPASTTFPPRARTTFPATPPPPGRGSTSWLLATASSTWPASRSPGTAGLPASAKGFSTAGSNSTALIAAEMANRPTRADGSPRVLVSALAVGYYGDVRGQPDRVRRGRPAGVGFLADVCVAWEAAAVPAAAAGVRVATVRVGLVLAKDGGALRQLARPFRWYLGGPVGSGRQWVSWIHVDDLAGLFVLAFDRADVSGPINGTAPEPVTNWGFSRTPGGRPASALLGAGAEGGSAAGPRDDGRAGHARPAGDPDAGQGAGVRVPLPAAGTGLYGRPYIKAR